MNTLARPLTIYCAKADIPLIIKNKIVGIQYGKGSLVVFSEKPNRKDWFETYFNRAMKIVLREIME